MYTQHLVSFCRDQFLDILYDHANLDCNAFVRSKAVQILTSLVKAEALPTKRFVHHDNIQ